MEKIIKLIYKGEIQDGWQGKSIGNIAISDLIEKIESLEGKVKITIEWEDTTDE